MTFSVDHNCRFENRARRATRVDLHRFDGGYDPSSPLTWTPQQAAEFTIFHDGTPQHAGMQLRTTIQHWSGTNLAEFLTRLYLGHTTTDTKHNHIPGRTTNKITYEPQNVRTPQWKGLDTREGILALKDLLREALSKETLSAEEISRFGDQFLLKEYRWPSQTKQWKSVSSSANFSDSQSGGVVFEKDSFYCLGHAQTLARVLIAVRKERGCGEFNSNEIATMVTLPENRNEDREAVPMKMIDFFRTISAHTTLTATDKANIVQRMAISGWSPGSISRFMAELLPKETQNENHVVDEIRRLQGDAFYDFPSQATMSDSNAKRDHVDDSAIENAVAKVAQTIGKTNSTLLSKKQLDEKSTVPSEYEDLVQSYWDKVEVTNPQNKKVPAGGYGVPKSKSIKKRDISGKFLSKTNSLIES